MPVALYSLARVPVQDLAIMAFVQRPLDKLETESRYPWIRTVAVPWWKSKRDAL